MTELDRGIADLQADARRRGMKVLLATGGALILVGLALFVLGLTYEPPRAEELLASRSVPHGFEWILRLGGGAIVVAGLLLLRKAARVERG